MFSASSLGEKRAMFILVESAIKHKKVNSEPLVAPLQHLTLLAKQDDPSAMVMLAKVQIVQGKEQEALKWCREASSFHRHAQSVNGVGEALCMEGEILFQRKDKAGAEAAWRRAAFEFDDPWGYYYLSQFETRESRTKMLLKAAASGVTRAAHDLGILELEKVTAKPKRGSDMEGKPTVRTDELWMAREWFEIAARGGIGESMLHLALVDKAVGIPEEGLKWLEKAESIPELKEAARKTRIGFENETIELFDHKL